MGRRSRCLLALLALLVPLRAVLAVPTTSAITGDWLTEGGDGVIQIAPCDQGLCGRIVGIDRDPNEPVPLDPEGRSRCGLTILVLDPEPDGGIWSGHVTDPRDGTTYRAEVRVDAAGRLRLRGYIGIPLLGQTQIWHRFTGHITGICRFVQGDGRDRGHSDTVH